jgi:polyphenol oxidase
MAAEYFAREEVCVSVEGVEWLAVPGWRELDWLWHGFSTRRSGVSRVYLPEGAKIEAGMQTGELNLGFTVDDDAAYVRENRLRLITAVTGSWETELITVRQVHSDVSVVAFSGPKEGSKEGPATADGILTDKDGLLLGIMTADCIPVLVADPARRAVAAFHAGWRGTVQRVVESGIAKMRAEFGSEPERLIAAIGPGIGACCYTVGDEVRREFESRFEYGSELFSANDAGPALRLDLVEANRRQLLAAGLSAGSIAAVGGCTSCQPERFYSHRASGGHAGRMMTVIGIRPEEYLGPVRT